MGVAGVADVTAGLEGQPLGGTHLLQARGHGLGSLRAELPGHVSLGRRALLGEGGVEVEGMPGHGEGVLLAAGDGPFVDGDCLLEAVLAHVALAVLDLRARI